MSKLLGIADKTYKKKIADNFYMLLNPTEHIQQQLFWYGYYEKNIGDLLKKVVKPGDVFLDFGANIGYFSLLVAHELPTTKIFSFEPIEELFVRFNKNISINDFKNVKAINTAIGEINEERDIFLSGADNLGMSSFKHPENYSGVKEKVQVIRIDDWLKTNQLSRVDVIKMDIEGSELFALKGMEETLNNYKPVMIIEINPETLSLFHLTPAYIYDFLRQLNFNVFIINENSKLTPIDTKELNQTVNVLCIHDDKMKSFCELFNN